jgi:hypothetical protein
MHGVYLVLVFTKHLLLGPISSVKQGTNKQQPHYSESAAAYVANLHLLLLLLLLLVAGLSDPAVAYCIFTGCCAVQLTRAATNYSIIPQPSSPPAAAAPAAAGLPSCIPSDASLANDSASSSPSAALGMSIAASS